MSHEAAIRAALALDDDLAVERLAGAGQVRACAPDEIVFRQGDPPWDGMYVVLSGTVRVYGETPEGDEIRIGSVTAGGLFGEVALLDRGPRTASVAAVSDCELLQLTRPAFEECLARLGVGLALRVLESLSRRLREASDRAARQQLREQALRAEMELERHRGLARLVAAVARAAATAPAGERGVMLAACERHAAARAEAAATEGDVLEAIEDAVALQGAIGPLQVGVESGLPAPSRRWAGDAGALGEVLLAGLANVADHAHAPGDRGRAVVRVEAVAEDRLQVEVRDFGAGLAAEDAARAFDPFFTTARDRGHQGLGLALVRDLVEGSLRGEATLESRPGAGATLRLTFPRVLPALVGRSTRP